MVRMKKTNYEAHLTSDAWVAVALFAMPFQFYYLIILLLPKSEERKRDASRYSNVCSVM